MDTNNFNNRLQELLSPGLNVSRLSLKQGNDDGKVIDGGRTEDGL